MSNGDDQQECCASLVCCNPDDGDKALVQWLEIEGGLNEVAAARVAKKLRQKFDMLPKAAGLATVVNYIQAHPYR